MVSKNLLPLPRFFAKESVMGNRATNHLKKTSIARILSNTKKILNENF